MREMWERLRVDKEDYYATGYRNMGWNFPVRIPSPPPPPPLTEQQLLGMLE